MLFLFYLTTQRFFPVSWRFSSFPLCNFCWIYLESTENIDIWGSFSCEFITAFYLALFSSFSSRTSKFASYLFNKLASCLSQFLHEPSLLVGTYSQQPLVPIPNWQILFPNRKLFQFWINSQQNHCLNIRLDLAKLHVIINRKNHREIINGKSKISCVDSRMNEKDSKELQQKLTTEKEKFIKW